MAYYKPQSPIKNGEDYIYPLTVHDQIIMPDGNRWDGKTFDETIVVNNVTTTAEGFILDARQGQVLNNLITQTASNLSQSISQKASTANYTATLSSSGWSSSAPYTQTVSVSGILASDTPFVDINMSGASTGSAGEALTEAWTLVGRITANAGSITAYCYKEKPTVNIPLILKVVR